MKTLHIDFTRMNNDANGNPRYVCHYLEFKPWQPADEPYKKFDYTEAVKMANSLGGRKFHNRQYGGGLVFQSCNLISLTASIMLMTGHAVKYSREPHAYESKHGNKNLKYRAFYRDEVTNRNGNFKKWFKLDGVKYTLVKE